MKSNSWIELPDRWQSETRILRYECEEEQMLALKMQLNQMKMIAGSVSATANIDTGNDKLIEQSKRWASREWDTFELSFFVLFVIDMNRRKAISRSRWQPQTTM